MYRLDMLIVLGEGRQMPDMVFLNRPEQVNSLERQMTVDRDRRRVYA
jgi:hypothetical protein